MSETKLYYLGTGTEFIKAQCKEYKTMEGALKAAAKDESLVVWDAEGNVIGSLTDNVPDGALKTNPDGSADAFDAEGNKVGTVDGETVAAVTGNTSGDGDADVSGDNEQNASQDNAQQGKDGDDDAKGTTAQENTENGQNEANTTSDNENHDNDAGASGDNENHDDDASTSGEDEDSEEQMEEQVGQFHVTVICDGSLRLRRSASFTIDNECGRASKGQTYIGKRIFMCDGLPMVETVDGLFLSAAGIHVNIERME